MIILIGSKTNKQAPALATRATLEEKILIVLGTSLVGGPRYNPPVSGMFPAVACLAEICRDLEMSSARLQLQQQHSTTVMLLL